MDIQWIPIELLNMSEDFVSEGIANVTTETTVRPFIPFHHADEEHLQIEHNFFGFQMTVCFFDKIEPLIDSTLYFFV